MDDATYITFDAIKNNFTAIGNSFNLFDKSTITASFINENIVDTSDRLTSIFMRKYKRRFYFEPVYVESNSIDYETIYNDIKEIIAQTDYELKYKYEKLIKTLSLEYNPIWNKDGAIIHEYTRTPNLTTAVKDTNTDSTTHGLVVTTTPNTTTTTEATSKTTNTPNTTTTTTTSGTTTETPNTASKTINSVSPYNSGSSQLHDTSETKNTGTTTSQNSAENSTKQSGTDTSETTDNSSTKQTGTVEVKNAGTDSTDHTENSTREETGTDEIKEKTVEQGNIGVTSTQYMIKQERDISNFDIISEYISDIINKISLDTYKLS